MSDSKRIGGASWRIAALAIALASSEASQAQQDFSQVEIKTHELADGLYYLEGSGGNIGVSVGDDGVFLIDDQYAPLSEKIIAAIRALSDEPIRFVFNTHHHGDHTGGNGNMSEAGAVIVAHENVRINLLKGFSPQDLNAALNAEQRAGLPIVTFSDAVDFHLNGHDIHAFHVPPAHTDGDSFVVFGDLNIIHAGDVFRTTGYPRADANANGSVLGIMSAYETLIGMADANTRILPGHGVVSTRADLQSQLAMFTTIRDRVQAGIDANKTLEQIQQEKPTAEFDAQWSGGNANAGNELVAVFFNELSAR